MGSGILLLPVSWLLLAVSVLLLVLKRPPNEGRGRVWRFLFGSAGMFAGVVLLAFVHAKVTWPSPRPRAEYLSDYALDYMGRKDPWNLIEAVLGTTSLAWGGWMAAKAVAGRLPEQRR